MILPIHELIKTQIRAVAKRLYGLDDTAIPSITIQIPPNRTIGDLAVPVAFELAKVARKAPRVISTELVDALGAVSYTHLTLPTNREV